MDRRKNTTCVMIRIISITKVQTEGVETPETAEAAQPAPTRGDLSGRRCASSARRIYQPIIRIMNCSVGTSPNVVRFFRAG
jgi:hypothetical protein